MGLWRVDTIKTIDQINGKYGTVFAYSRDISIFYYHYKNAEFESMRKYGVIGFDRKKLARLVEDVEEYLGI